MTAAIVGTHPYADKFPMLSDGAHTLSGYSTDPIALARIKESAEFSGFYDVAVYLDGASNSLTRPCDPSLVRDVIARFAPRITFVWKIEESRAPIVPPRSKVTYGPRVYFIADEDGFIKIGKAAQPTARLASLQTASRQELKLIGTIPGGHDEESGLHERFAADRIRGEWFRPSKELTTFIAAVAP